MADNRIKYTFIVDDRVSPALDKVSKTAISASKEIDKAVKNAENFIKAAPNNLSNVLKVQLQQFEKLRTDLEKDLFKFQNLETILRSKSTTKKQDILSQSLDLGARFNPNSGLNVSASISNVKKELEGANSLLTSFDSKIKNIKVYSNMLELEKFFGSIYPEQVQKSKTELTSLELFHKSLAKTTSWNDLINKAISYRNELEKIRIQGEKTKAYLGMGAASVAVDNRGYNPQVTKTVGSSGYFGNYSASGNSIANPLSSSSKTLEQQKQITDELRKQQIETNKLAFFSQGLYKRIFDIAVGWRMVNSAVDVFVNSIANVPKFGIELEQTNAIFKAVFQTTKQVNAEFEFLDKLAARTGTNIGLLREQFGQFSASAIPAGESLTKIEQIFSDLTEVGAVLHLPEERMKSIFTAINQMYGKNQVMMEELKRQLGNQLPAAVSIFAIATGRSTKQLIEDMRAGTVFPKETLAQFAATYKAIYADTNSLAIATNGLNANWQRFQSTIIYATQDIYNNVKEYLIGGLKLATTAIETFAQHSTALFTGLGLLLGTEIVANFAAISAKLTPLLTLLLRFSVPITIITGLALAVENLLNKTYKLGDVTATGGEIVKAAWDKMTEAANKYFTQVDEIEKQPSFGKFLAEDITQAGQDIIDGTKTLGFGIKSLYDVLAQDAPIGSKDYLNFNQMFDKNKATFDKITSEFGDSVKKNIENNQPTIKPQLQSEEAEAEMKRVLLLTSQGSEEIATLTSQEVSRQIQLQANLSSNIIKSFEAQANREVSLLSREASILDNKIRTNNIGVLSWYKQRIALLEKEKKIKLDMLNLEEKQLKQNLELKTNLETQYDPKIGGFDTEATANLSKKVLETGILHKAGLLPYLQQAKPDNSDYFEVNRINKELVEAATQAFNKFKEEMAKVPVENYTPAQKLVAENSPLLKQFPYAEDVIKLSNRLENIYKLQDEQAQRNYEGLKLQNSIMESGKNFNVVPLKSNTAALQDLIRINARRFNIDENLLRALIKQESGGNQKAMSTFQKKGGSIDHAYGLTQVVPTYHPEYDKSKIINDPAYNVAAGSEILAKELKKFNGDIVKALAAYNAGAGNVYKAIEAGQKANDSFVKHLPKETKGYVKNITAMLGENIPNIVESARLDPSRGTTSLVRFDANTTNQLNDINLRRKQIEFEAEQKTLEIEQQRQQLELEKGNELKSLVLEQNKLLFGKQKEVQEIEKYLQFRDKELLISEELLSYQKATTEEKQKLDSLGLGEKHLKEAKEALDYLKRQSDILAEINQAERLRVANLEAYNTAQEFIDVRGSNGTDFEKLMQSSLLAQQFLSTKQSDILKQKKFIQEQYFNEQITDQEKVNKFKQLDLELENFKVKADGIKEYFIGNISPMITQGLTDWATGAKTAGQAFKELGVNIVKMFIDIIAQMIALAAAKAAVNAISSMFGGMGGMGGMANGGSVSSMGNAMNVNFMPALATGGQVLQFPYGGTVKGAGTSVSDSIIANVPEGSYIIKANSAKKLRNSRLVRLSNGEEVIPPHIVEAYGKEYFDNLNKTGEASFASGGLVGNNKSTLLTSTKHSSSNKVTNINKFETHIYQKEGEDSKQLSERVAQEIMTKIAKDEANKAATRHISIYDKQQNTRKRRSV